MIQIDTYQRPSVPTTEESMQDRAKSPLFPAPARRGPSDTAAAIPPTEEVPFVSPPQAPWPRVFPDL
jgi:hypothetical protein